MGTKKKKSKPDRGKTWKGPKAKLDKKECKFKLKLGRSSIHRWGVYAKERIPAKKKVIEYTGERIGFYNKNNLGNGQDLEMDLALGRATIISVILNAIDDELKITSPAVRLPQLEDLGPLVAMVNNALERGWTVLMTADHGHTWSKPGLL